MRCASRAAFAAAVVVLYLAAQLFSSEHKTIHELEQQNQGLLQDLSRMSAELGIVKQKEAAARAAANKSAAELQRPGGRRDAWRDEGSTHDMKAQPTATRTDLPAPVDQQVRFEPQLCARSTL
jgi:septal ring factor EnvC (AmiA/AmiB activator)